MRKLISLYFFLGVLLLGNAQTSLMSFTNGIGISSADSSYSMNFRFRMQNRAMVNTADDKDFSPKSFEGRVRRCRLSFTGHVVNPKLSYYIQLSFSRGDMDWSVSDVTNQNLSPNVVRDAVIYYKANKHWQIGMGQTKLPGNRQRVISSGSQQFYDRSIVNATFTPDRDFGFFSSYTVKGQGKSLALLKAAITTGEGRNSNQSNAGLAYTGRIEFLPFGAFTAGGDYFEGDLMREEKPKLSIAGGYMLNDMAVRTGGQLGKDLYAAKSFNLYMADILFKYRGLAISSEYIRRDANNPFVVGSDNKVRVLQTGDGINTQVSYCFKSMWEIALRQALVSPHHDVLKNYNQSEQYVIGLSKYLNKHKVKAQFNLQYTRDKNLVTHLVSNNYFSAVFQVELGI